MRLVKSAKHLERLLESLRRKGLRIGFVPTMGYLHDGHLSLVRLCQRENDRTVVSLFVNPLQFGPHEDYRRYPRDLRRDITLLKKSRVDFLFAPAAADFYPKDFQSAVSVPRLSRGLCGAARPTHFTGVATVVMKLLQIVRPRALYLGQKDYQQFRVLQRMIQDFSVPTQVRLAPIARDREGLAMSSRNVFLSKAHRREARCLFHALLKSGELIRAGMRDAGRIRRILRDLIRQEAPHGRLDYAEIADAHSLAPVVKLKIRQRVLVALAVFFGKTRLIDNALIKVK